MLLAQATGTMSGYVKDSSGGVVPQAKVTATLVQRGTTFIAETNAEGFYNLPALDPGEYTLAVEKQGFQRNLQTGLTLTVGQNLRVDASLTVGQLAQEVKVTGQAPLVDTTSGNGLQPGRRSSNCGPAAGRPQRDEPVACLFRASWVCALPSP